MKRFLVLPGLVFSGLVVLAVLTSSRTVAYDCTVNMKASEACKGQVTGCMTCQNVGDGLCTVHYRPTNALVFTQGPGHERYLQTQQIDCLGVLPCSVWETWSNAECRQYNPIPGDPAGCYWALWGSCDMCQKGVGYTVYYPSYCTTDTGCEI